MKNSTYFLPQREIATTSQSNVNLSYSECENQFFESENGKRQHRYIRSGGDNMHYRRKSTCCLVCCDFSEGLLVNLYCLFSFLHNKTNVKIDFNIKKLLSSPKKIYYINHQSINQFSGPAYPWGVAGAAARVGASKHVDPLQQRIDALLGCQGETN